MRNRGMLFSRKFLKKVLYKGNMALSIDEKIDKERIKQFATQLQYVPSNVRVWFEETFSGERGIEFYEGLISAYSVMHIMVQNLPSQELKNVSGSLVAFVASELQKKYNQQQRTP